MVDNGLSVVAVDEATDKIVGAFIGYDGGLDEDSVGLRICEGIRLGWTLYRFFSTHPR